MKLHDELEVYVELESGLVRAGLIGASYGGGRVLAASWFRYDSSYFSQEDSYALDPELRSQGTAVFSGEDRQLFGAFQDLAPDDWGKRVIDANLANARRSNPSIPDRVGEFDYLALASDETRLGSLRLRPVGEKEWVGSSRVRDLEQDGLAAYAAAAARFEDYEATAEDLALLGAPGTSAGGVRPKVSVRSGGELKLLKLPSNRDRGRDGEAWEYVAICLARRASINVQQGELMRPERGLSSLALHRFDRGSDGKRIGYMSARTAMSLGDQGHGQVTYEDFADTVDELTGGNRSQLRDLFKRVALSVLISNDDDHWKNHGFLRGNDAWRLSPAFDINPSPNGGSIESRQISSNDDPRHRDLRNLIDTASTYGLAEKDMAEALSEVLLAVQGWSEIARSVGIAEQEIAQMALAFSEQQQSYAEAAIERAMRGSPLIDLAVTSEGQQISTLEQGQTQSDASPGEGAIWVSPHVRQGRRVEGFWRRKPSA